MPFGGLDHWENAPGDPGPVINLDELKFYHRPMHLFDDSMNILTGLLGVLIIMVPVRWIYVGLNDGKAANPGVGAGLFVLPMVVTAIIRSLLPLVNEFPAREFASSKRTLMASC